MDEATAMQTRIETLEVKLGLAEDSIDALNLALFRQQAKLDLLQREFRLLYQQIRVNTDAEADTDDPVRDLRAEIPPHY